jgi:hypothetical protein
MCIVLIAYRVADGYPVVVGANRDEAYARGGGPPSRVGYEDVSGLLDTRGGGPIMGRGWARGTGVE